ncbi:hypothetical protein AY606_05985 [Acinetobacter sp. SFB]|uniref:tail completion protein gp17 n=1 Tax=Acinetobacter sp. SFB TaxID=1805634 RepID=UPI0007D8164C|nr:DUF3168 domain-containing protein [Acinetobacter sp. SFB]OAL78975.1 hypothetical protein AY606_05985 [Acinetobacter sp. SFB]
MLIIPLESLCEADYLLKQLLSDSEGLKVAEFDADNIPSAPYTCWQIINANPEQYLSDRSDMDDIYVQIDIYASKKAEARQIAKLMRNAIEEDCYIESYTGTEKEPETNLYRIRLDTRWYEEP